MKKDLQQTWYIHVYPVKPYLKDTCTFIFIDAYLFCILKEHVINTADREECIKTGNML